jgi:hypothetical protein
MYKNKQIPNNNVFAVDPTATVTLNPQVHLKDKKKTQRKKKINVGMLAADTT